MSVNAVLIEGNVIETGYYDTGSSGYNICFGVYGISSGSSNKEELILSNNTVTSQHKITMDVQGPNAKITNNICRGISDDLTTNMFVNYIGTFADIRFNRFVRGSSNLLAYVNVTAHVNLTVGVGYVADNYFDQTTVDGSSEALITGDSYVNKYRNVNQAYYKYIDPETYFVGATSSYYSRNMGAGVGYCKVINTQAALNTSANAQIYQNLSTIFEPGYQITGVQMIYNSSSISGISVVNGSQFTLELTAWNPLDSDFVANTGFAKSAIQGTATATATLTTSNTYPSYVALSNGTLQYLTLTPTDNSFKLTSNKDVVLKVLAQIALLSSSSYDFNFIIMVKAIYSP